jgi:nicotinamidase-related amidase
MNYFKKIGLEAFQSRRLATNKELGVWTYDDCALLLIDYQNEMFETIRSETSADLANLNVRLLAKAAKAFDMPIVLSTVGSNSASTVRRMHRSSRSFPW